MSDISLNDVGVRVLLPLVNISLIIPFPSQNFWVRRGRGVQCSHERGTLILIKVNIVGVLVWTNMKRAYLIWFRHRMTPRYAGPSRLAVDDIEVEKLVQQFRQGTSYLMVGLTSYLVVLICWSEVVCSLLKANWRNVNNFRIAYFQIMMRASL